ncbi:22427_t:CDS:1, partial [Gigaspora rosea]
SQDLRRRCYGILEIEIFQMEFSQTYTRVISGKISLETERYPGEMLRPKNENVNLPNNIYQILGEDYSILYNFDPDNMIALSIDRVIIQFGRLKIGAKIYGSKNAIRYRS